MAALQTQPHSGNVENFLRKIEDKQKREDSFELHHLMRDLTHEPAKMWGDSMIGYGSYHYKYASGHEGEWFLTGFSPRKQNITLYIMAGFEQYDSLMQKLGKYKTGKSCLYIKKLADIDIEVLKAVILESMQHMKSSYPTSR